MLLIYFSHLNPVTSNILCLVMGKRYWVSWHPLMASIGSTVAHIWSTMAYIGSTMAPTMDSTSSLPTSTVVASHTEVGRDTPTLLAHPVPVRQVHRCKATLQRDP